MDNAQTYTFKTETQQLLQILIHSLYAEREVFLRELVSNASDAITRLKYVQLTEKEIRDAEAEPAIHINVDKDARTITIQDNGIGMTRDEIVENLGTIGHSGVKSFLEAVKESNANINDVIGQFGVGFYSAFMVADNITIESLSFRKDAEAVRWESDGVSEYAIGESEKTDRGTTITLHLNENADEFLDDFRLKGVIRKHSNYIPYPIFVGDAPDEGEPSAVNEQTALWRKGTQDIEDEQYNDFYRQFTLDFEEPISHMHLNIDAPVQLYALLYVPGHAERQMFSPRQQEGLELFARKVLIQEYTLDLLPRAFRWMHGIVDSEDIPLNVSRETVQSSRTIRQIKKVVTGRLISHFADMQQKEPENYARFWKSFGMYIKEGVATDEQNGEKLQQLLVFHSIKHPNEYISLKQYVDEMPEGQDKIYYLLGEDESSLRSSPHLELIEKDDADVLLFSSEVDPFMLMRMKEYDDKPLTNLAMEGQSPDLSKENEKSEADAVEDQTLVGRFKTILGDKVSDIRTTDRLTRSPARLVNAAGAMTPEMQKVYELLKQDHEEAAKVLEINPEHPLVQGLIDLPEGDPKFGLLANQIFENALLLEGLHPDPASMIERIQEIMQSTLE
mgnify:CR=1 FL=1